MATAQQLNGESHDLVRADSSPMDLISIALQHNAAVDVIERLAALQEKIMLRDAEIHFNDALSAIQAEIKRIAPDLLNPDTSSKYASYTAIDAVIRPIYTSRGMSLSFSQGDCAKAEHIRSLCFVSLGAYTRVYQIEMPTDGKGPKGGAVMSKIHAAATADSYAKRYLVKNIFNIAIGEADRDGNTSAAPSSDPSRAGISEKRRGEMCGEIARASDAAQLRTIFLFAYREAHTAKDRSAMDAYMRAKDARKREIR